MHRTLKFVFSFIQPVRYLNSPVDPPPNASANQENKDKRRYEDPETTAGKRKVYNPTRRKERERERERENTWYMIFDIAQLLFHRKPRCAVIVFPLYSMQKFGARRNSMV